ncbi:MAG: hypothetical protein ABFC89_03765 [Methanospirillum sp.]
MDRNEQLVLSLASRNRVEQFTLRDLQRWTGWSYYKARRLLLEYESRGLRYSGLLDRSPALTLLDRTTSEDDGEGRAVKQRQSVFLFDAVMYRESRSSGLVWLEPDDAEGPGCGTDDCRNTAATPAATSDEHRNGQGSENGERSAVSGSSCCSAADHAPQSDTDGDTEDATPPRTLLSRSAAHQNNDIDNMVVFEKSEGDTSADRVAADVAAPVAAGLQQHDCCTLLDPHDLIPLDTPTFEPCSACGRKPSFYREKWRRGMTARRVLCRRCYDSAVRRAQAAVEPLPRVIVPGAMERVTASVGRCGLCGLEKAAWKGEGVHLCETCFQRESRRAVLRRFMPSRAYRARDRSADRRTPRWPYRSAGREWIYSIRLPRERTPASGGAS